MTSTLHGFKGNLIVACGDKGDIYRFSFEDGAMRRPHPENLNRIGASGFINSSKGGYNRGGRSSRYGSQRTRFVQDVKQYIFSMVRAQKDSVFMTDSFNNLIHLKPKNNGIRNCPQETLVESGNPKMSKKFNGKMLRASPELEFLAVKTLDNVITVFKIKLVEKYVENTRGNNLNKLGLKYNPQGYKQYRSITDFELSNSTVVAITKKGYLVAKHLLDANFSSYDEFLELNEAELKLERIGKSPFFNSVAVSDSGEYVAVGSYDQPRGSKTKTLFITLVKYSYVGDVGIRSFVQLGTVEKNTQIQGKNWAKKVFFQSQNFFRSEKSYFSV